MTFEETGTYFVSYRRPEELTRRYLFVRSAVLILSVLALVFICASNAVSYVSLPSSVCWVEDTSWYPYSTCMKKGAQRTFWSIDPVPYGKSGILYTFCGLVPVLAVLCVVNVILAATWIAVTVVQRDVRDEADTQREKGEELQVIMRCGRSVRSVRKTGPFYRYDEVVRRRKENKMCVAIITLLAISCAVAVAAMGCHAAHIVFMGLGSTVSGFFACLLITLICLVAALLMSCVPYLSGLTCCLNAEKEVPIGEHDNRNDNLLSAAASQQDGNAEEDRHLASEFSPYGTGEDADENGGGLFVLPNYVYSAAARNGDSVPAPPLAPPAAPPTNQAEGLSSTGKQQLERDNTAAVASGGEQAPPLYAQAHRAERARRQ